MQMCLTEFNPETVASNNMFSEYRVRYDDMINVDWGGDGDTYHAVRMGSQELKYVLSGERDFAVE
eukprot:9960237-Heterocapsa_arctica.AAC.1